MGRTGGSEFQEVIKMGMNPIKNSIPDTPNFFHQALSYLGEGLSLLPIHPKAKNPKIPWEEFQKRRPTKEEIRKWFSEDEAGIGIVCGDVSNGFLVLEFDEQNWDEIAVLFEEAFPRIAYETRRVETGGGRLHLWIRCREIPKDLTRIEWRFPELGDAAVELRANGHYVVAPPSIHPSGERYRFLNDKPILEISWDKLQEIIAWFDERGKRTVGGRSKQTPIKTRNTTSREVKEEKDIIKQAAEYYLRRALAVATVGNRNDTGFWLACQLRDLGLDESEAEAYMIRYAEGVPQGEHPYTVKEALSSLRSAYKREPREPAIPSIRKERKFTPSGREIKRAQLAEIVDKLRAVASPSPGYEFENPHAFIEELTLEEFRALLKALNEEPAIPFASPTHPDARRKKRKKRKSAAKARRLPWLLVCEYFLSKALERAEPGKRNKTGTWLACQLRDAGVPKEIAEEYMVLYAAHVPRVHDDPYTSEEALNTLKSIYKNRKHSERGPAIPGYLKALFKKAELAQRLVMKLDIPQGCGVRASTLRTVLLPLIAAALAFGKRKPDGSLVANVKRLSLRTLEWLTGLHRNTVWKALKRLTQGIEIAGVKVEVSKQEHRGMRLAPVYKVTISAQLLSDGILQICDTAEGVRHRSAVSLGSVTSLQFSHDAFRRKRRGTALGKTDYFVLIALSELSSAVVSELAERLKLNHTTVWRSLRKLENYGVVKRIDKRGKAVIWAIGELSEMKLDEVADLCGVTGKRKRTAILHARERKEHDEDFERWVTAPPQKRIRKMDLKAVETSQDKQGERILVLSFDGDCAGLIEEFEKEAPDLACQTLRVKRGDGRLQLWFRYDGGFKPRSWLIGKARVELKKEVPRVKEGDVSLNDRSIVKITDKQVQGLIAWLGEQAGSKNLSALRKFQQLGVL